MRSFAPLVVLAALCASSTGVGAWKIDAHLAAPTVNATGEHESLTRTFTISSGGALDALYLAVPGRVFVELDPSALAPPPTEAPLVTTEAPTAAPEPATEAPAPETPPPSENATTQVMELDYQETVVARIEVKGDSAELLDIIEVVPLDAELRNGLKLHLQNADGAADGYLVTTVYLMVARSLTAITLAVDGDVVVDDRVLAITDSRASIPLHAEDGPLTSELSLAVVGGGNLFVFRPMVSLPTGGVSLASLSLAVTGSGSIQLPFLTGAHVELSKAISIAVDGSGAVRIAPDAVNVPAFSASLSGSGVVVIESMGAVLISSSLELSVAGSGTLSLATGGAVDTEKISLSGSGQLLAGSIKSNTADVSVDGSGLVIVQAVKNLTVSTSLSGSVGYINARPATIDVHGGWFWRKADKIVYHAETNTMLAAHLDGVPAKHPVYQSVRTATNTPGNDPDVTIVSTEPPKDKEGVLSMAAHAVGEMSVVALVAMVVAGVAVVAVATSAVRRFRLRRQYTQLL